MTREQDLQAVRWSLQRLGLIPEVADPSNDPFAIAVAPYLDPARWYHDISHISEMVSWLAVHAPRNYLPILIPAAVFHDYVDPSLGGMAVDQSAVAFDAWCREFTHMTPDAIGAGVRAILSTQGSHTSDDPLSQYLIDADLMRFAFGDWRRWAAEIRCEYPDAPLSDYRAARKLILEAFALREPFFYFADREVELIARDKLAEQIASLG